MFQLLFRSQEKFDKIHALLKKTELLFQIFQKKELNYKFLLKSLSQVYLLPQPIHLLFLHKKNIYIFFYLVHVNIYQHIVKDFFCSIYLKNI